MKRSAAEWYEKVESGSVGESQMSDMAFDMVELAVERDHAQAKRNATIIKLNSARAELEKERKAKAALEAEIVELKKELEYVTKRMDAFRDVFAKDKNYVIDEVVAQVLEKLSAGQTKETELVDEEEPSDLSYGD